MAKLIITQEFIDSFISERDGETTTPAFWTCKCKSNRIHPKKQSYCMYCDAIRDECPDSLTIDTLAYLTKKLNDYIIV